MARDAAGDLSRSAFKRRDRVVIGVVALCVAGVLASCGKKQEARDAGEVGTPDTTAVRLGGRPAGLEPYTFRSAESPRRGGTIVVGAVSAPRSFNPFVANEGASIEIIARMFDGLVELDCATGEYRPALATRWEVSPDGRRWTFHLRRGVVWADGAPFTAADVLWNFQVVYDDSVNATSLDILSLGGEPFAVTKGADADGAETVVIETPRPYGPLLNALATALFIVPKHVWDAAYREGRIVEALGIDTPPERVFGTGPFRLEKVEPGRTVLARVGQYWKIDSGGVLMPYADRMVFVNAGDWNGWRLKFDAGEVDNYLAKPDEIAAMTDGAARGGFRLHDLGPKSGTNDLWLNQNPGRDEKGEPFVDPVKSAWFRDLRFRRALAHAIDREAIVRTVFGGHGTVIDGPISPSDRAWFNAGLPRYAHDPAAARGLLGELGMRDVDGDGTLEDGGGRDVAFTILTNAENPVRISMGRLIEADLRAVGVAATLDVLEFNALVARIHETFRYEACLLALSGGGDPAGGLDVWLSSGALHQFDPMQDAPATQWEREVDSLFTACVGIVEHAERKRLFDRVQELYAVNLGWIYLANENTVLAVRDRFGNLRPGTFRAFNEFCWNEDELFVKR